MLTMRTHFVSPGICFTVGTGMGLLRIRVRNRIVVRNHRTQPSQNNGDVIGTVKLRNNIFCFPCASREPVAVVLDQVLFSHHAEPQNSTGLRRAFCWGRASSTCV